MKKHVVTIVLTLSLIVGLLISGPAALASAKSIDCSEIGSQSIKVGAIDKSKVEDLIGNISDCFNSNNNYNWVKDFLNKCAKPEGTTPDNSQPEEDSDTPIETPAPEKPDEAPTPEKPDETPAPEKPDKSQTPSGLTAEQSRMLELVNQERTKAGLKALAWDAELAKVADFKAQDMVQNNYFSHTSPTYGSPFDMMKNFGIKYRAAGENLAGYNSVDKAHTGLMNSDGHRANILNSNFTHIGIGVQKSPRYGYVFVQMFIGK